MFHFLHRDSDISDLPFHDLKRFGHLQRFAHGFMRRDTPLSRADRELIAAYVSGVNECKFCFGIHRQTAKRFQVEPSLLDSLLKNIDEANISESRKSLFRFLKQLTLYPSRITEPDIQAVIDAGLSEESLHEAIVIGSLFGFYNRLVDGHGIRGTEHSILAGSGMLYRFGYRIPWFAKFFR